MDFPCLKNGRSLAGDLGPRLNNPSRLKVQAQALPELSGSGEYRKSLCSVGENRHQYCPNSFRQSRRSQQSFGISALLGFPWRNFRHSQPGCAPPDLSSFLLTPLSDQAGDRQPSPAGAILLHKWRAQRQNLSAACVDLKISFNGRQSTQLNFSANGRPCRHADRNHFAALRRLVLGWFENACPSG